MKILSFGEIMVRLTPPNYLLLEQCGQLNMEFVGTGVNILSALARFGYKTSIFSAVPENNLGKAAKANIRKLGINDDFIYFNGNHMGSFFVELGYGNRPTEVTYQNRINSSFCMNDFSEYNFENVIKDIDIVHICGINLSLTQTTRNSAIKLAEIAHKHDKTVAFDFNYRPSLNTQTTTTKMREYYQEILQYSDIVFGSQRDITDLLGIQADETLSPRDKLEKLCREFVDTYKIKIFTGTIRTKGKDEKIAGFAFRNNILTISTAHEITILDRIGAGDAYASGIIHGFLQQWETEKMVDFATVNCVLAHATYGDVPMLYQNQIENYIANPGENLIR